MRRALPGAAGRRGQRLLRGLARAAAAGAWRARRAALWLDERRAGSPGARVALGGVGDVPVRVDVDALIGAEPGAEAFAAAGAAARAAVAEPRADLHASAEHRRHLAGVVVERALRAAGAADRREGVMDADVRAIQLTVNGRKRHVAVEPRRLLVGLPARGSRADRHATSAASRACAARARCCVDGETVRSCLMFAVQADGAEVDDRRGARRRRRAAPAAAAFWEHAAGCSAGSARRGC